MYQEGKYKQSPSHVQKWLLKKRRKKVIGRKKRLILKELYKPKF